MSIEAEIESFLEKHEALKMSFAVEYSSVVDWVAEFVPRRGHPLAREYNGPWRVQRLTLCDAVRAAMAKTETMLKAADAVGLSE